MRVIVLMMMCIARTMYLFLPTFLIMLAVQIVLYRTTKISLYNNLVKFIMKEV